MSYKVWKMFALFVLVNILAISAFGQHELSENEKKSIEKIEETYRTSWLKNDSKTILSLFAADATIYPNGLSPRIGIKAIGDFWFAPGASTTVIDEYEIEIEEISGTSTLAFSTGATKIKWTTTDKESKVSKRYTSSGSYLTVFSKRDKEWKIIKHIWNGKFEEIQ